MRSNIRSKEISKSDLATLTIREHTKSPVTEATALLQTARSEEVNAMSDSRKFDWRILTRTADLVRERINGIELMRSILDGTCKNKSYEHVDKEQVARELKWEQECLLDLIKDIRNGLLNETLDWIESEYCKEAEK